MAKVIPFGNLARELNSFRRQQRVLLISDLYFVTRKAVLSPELEKEVTKNYVPSPEPLIVIINDGVLNICIIIITNDFSCILTIDN